MCPQHSTTSKLIIAHKDVYKHIYRLYMYIHFSKSQAVVHPPAIYSSIRAKITFSVWCTVWASNVPPSNTHATKRRQMTMSNTNIIRFYMRPTHSTTYTYMYNIYARIHCPTRKRPLGTHFCLTLSCVCVSRASCAYNLTIIITVTSVRVYVFYT